MTDEERYVAAAHAVQSGIAAQIGDGSEKSLLLAAANPKHLRTGLNLAMVEHAALVGLLVSKGIITAAEYAKALADETEREKERMEKMLSDERGGIPITLR